MKWILIISIADSLKIPRQLLEARSQSGAYYPS